MQFIEESMTQICIEIIRQNHFKTSFENLSLSHNINIFYYFLRLNTYFIF